jgi:C-terminal processing protease CtpA/Prc
MILTDDFTASAAELFAAIMQDTGRALLYGTRTNGAGGAVDNVGTGVYSETSANLAIGIAVRNATVTTMDYPAVPYIENIGVRPDITADYMTVDNLVNRGKAFVDGFTAAMVNYITSRRQ